MHEDVVSGAEGDVEGVEIGTDQSQKDFCGDTEEHEGVVEALVDQRELSCFAQQGIEQLADHHSIEICRLAILDSFGGIAHGSVGNGRNLEDITFSPAELLTVDSLSTLLVAIQRRHPQILRGVIIVHPIKQGSICCAWTF